MPRLPDPRFAPDCAILVDGERVPARAGESVAVALLAAGRPLVARSYKYHRARGPFCLQGSCGSCLARVDGAPSRRTCRVPCRDGLRVETQNAFPDVRHDLLSVLDLAPARGLDHHHLLTFSRTANRALVTVSRRLAGLGRLPDRAPEPPPPAAWERWDALVVGSGPAGLGAAEVLATGGRRVLLAEQEPATGGRLRARLALAGEPDLAWAGEVAALLVRAGGEVATGAAVLGIWNDGGAPLAALAMAGPAPWLRLVRAPVIVLATGGTAQPPIFAGNDLPGIFDGRALSIALEEYGLVPGERCLVLDAGPDADAEAEVEAVAVRLAASGMRVERAPARAAAARGRGRVREVLLGDGSRRRCDCVASVAPRAPALELARQAGVPIAFHPRLLAFAAAAGRAGCTGVPGVHAAGEITGAPDGAAAAESGRRAGEAALRG